MQTCHFPACCGYEILHSFGNTYTAADPTAYTPEQVSAFLVNETAKYKKEGKAGLIATLNFDQMKKLGKVFKEQGFKVLGRSYHPNHDSTIYLLKKNLWPLEKAKKLGELELE